MQISRFFIHQIFKLPYYINFYGDPRDFVLFILRRKINCALAFHICRKEEEDDEEAEDAEFIIKKNEKYLNKCNLVRIISLWSR